VNERGEVSRAQSVLDVGDGLVSHRVSHGVSHGVSHRVFHQRQSIDRSELERSRGVNRRAEVQTVSSRCRATQERRGTCPRRPLIPRC
jgi:hypothetical protein